MEIRILEGDVDLELLDKAECYWIERGNVLCFEKAYRINRRNYDTGIHNCTYTVHGRTFTDLSCMKGETVAKIEDGELHKSSVPDEYEIRTYPDGEKFVYCSNKKPVFDSGDHMWDEWEASAVYADGQGINLIRCSYGYKIPSITIYLGLKKTESKITIDKLFVDRIE